MADTVGEIDIRGQNFERAVKGFANKLYKLSQILLNESCLQSCIHHGL